MSAACLFATSAGWAGAPPADRPVPRFVVRPLPKEYRVAPPAEPTGEDFYALGAAKVLVNRDCLVATVYRAPARAGGPVILTSLGWLAIGIPKGDLTYLTLDNPEPVGGFRVVAGYPLRRWSIGTCALEVRFIPIGSKMDWQGRFPGEQSDLWEWDPATASPRRLGRSVPVAGLMNALVGTDYAVEWSDVDAAPWNGTVHLARRDSGRSRPLTLRHLVRPPENARQVMCVQQFAPAEDRNSIIIADYWTDMQSRQRLDFAVTRLDLESGRLAWKLDGDALQKAIGGRTILDLQLVEGPVRPCLRLPILVRQDREGPEASKILWALDVKTGRLAGPYPLPWTNSVFGRVSFEHPRACATPNGERVAYHYAASDVEAPFAVFDLAAETTLTRRRLRDFDPAGFVSGQRLVLSGAYEVRCLAPPYTLEANRCSD